MDGGESRPAEGLSSQEAARRLQQGGPNRLPEPPRRSIGRELAAQMTHFFALMLWVAGALAIAAGMPQLGVAIFAVIVLNGLFAFLQEYRAERAGEKLRQLLPRRAWVLRDGVEHEIDAADLVCGDVVRLRSGDRVSADLNILQAYSLSLDTSTLTGESLPLPVSADDTVFAGSFVVEGEGSALVTATGASTRLAGIALLAQTGPRPVTPLGRELHRVVWIIAAAAVAAGLAFLPVAVLLGIRLTDAFLFALGVVVALVPEGLLPTVTLSLAWGAQRMADQHALVRRLESVETLGSTTFICTDKTGTLTLNQMAVVVAWTPDGECRIEGHGYAPDAVVQAEAKVYPALQRLARSAGYACTGGAVRGDGGWAAQGNPLEAAVAVFASRVLHRPARETPVQVFAFDPRRRRMSVIAGGELHVKGAPDSVLPRCRHAGSAGAAVQQMAARGLRVLAVAARPATADDAHLPADRVEAELELLGLLGIEDPPRAEAAAAITACRAAGIRVAMVTGDHPGTALAIAREVGLHQSGAAVLTGADLPTDIGRLGAMVDQDGIVLSRVTPEDKLRIALALRQRGHVVAMTGDGVNDGPALRQASIGVAMGRSGTDVAREAADLVLLDDNFATIVAAIRQGRATFANTRRFLTYHLTDNVAELTPFLLWALSGGRIPLALGVLQVLSLDVGTDILPALALGTEPAHGEMLQARAGGRHLLDAPVLWRAFGRLGPTEAVMEMLAFWGSLWAAGWRPGRPYPTGEAFLAASGAAFAAVVMGQMANALASRSTTQSPAALGWFANRYLIAAIAIEFGFLALLLGFGPLAHLLGHAPPTLTGAAIAAMAFPIVLLVDAVSKRIARHRSVAG